ncbi:N/A [soil metagenome]
MTKKILITGAAGRIAQWILPLLSDDFELILVDQKSGEMGGREILPLDITNYADVLAAMQGVDAVVHLAICSGRDYVTNNELFQADEGEEYLRFNEASIDVNVRGSYHIFEAARAAGVKRVVFGSSLTVLLGQPAYPSFSDALPIRPSNFYAVTKLWGEQLGEYFSRRHSMTVYCLRFGNPYPQPSAAKFKAWMSVPPGRRASVTFDDLAGSIEAALTVQDGPAFGAYTIVSACDDSLFDCSKASEIGWTSRTFCEVNGDITPIP